MKKKRLIILLAILFLAVAIFAFDRYGDRILPIRLNEDKIECIEIFYDNPIVIREVKPYEQLTEYVEYIESRKADFDGEAFEDIPIYRYEDMMFTTENGVRIIIGRDNGYYRIGGNIYSPAGRILAACPTDAIRETQTGESVYCVYDTDIGLRMYLFFSKEKNDYLVLDGFPIIMSKVLEYKDFEDIKIGDTSKKVQSIDPITWRHTENWDEAEDEWLSIYIEEGAGPTSIHLLKDGILKIEYKRIESGEYEITDIEYNEDFTLTGFRGDTCYKISELDYPSEDNDKVSILLSSENNADEIAEIAGLFNESVKHENQKMGTTHPNYVKITYGNGKEISFGCGVGAIFTVHKGKRQYNYVNGELNSFISELILNVGKLNFKAENVFVSPIPSQFSTEKELVKAIKTFKKDKRQLFETEDFGTIGNKDNLSEIDYYYMPEVIPEGYELNHITVTYDNVRSYYVKKGREYDSSYGSFVFGYWNESSGWTLDNTIKGQDLVQSQYSNEIYFKYKDTPERCSGAYFDVDGKVGFVLFPFAVSIEDEEEVKEIEQLCCFKMKEID